MNPSVKPHQSLVSTIRYFLLGLVLLWGLSGCGGSSGSDPEPLAQDASGLFKDGTAQLNAGALMLTDLRGFVHDDRLIMFSVQGHILFEGQITTINSDEFTATIDVYETGVKTQSDVAVTGNVMTESSITGTIAGTGNASGIFTLTFDPLYSRGATFERVDTTQPNTSIPLSFVGNVMSTMVSAETNNFNFDQVNVYDMLARIPGPIRCRSNGSYTIPDANINIYALNEEIVKADPGCTMSDTPGYTGFAAAIDGISTDDTLLYAVTNGTNAQFAILSK